jgi:hypothetical protein
MLKVSDGLRNDGARDGKLLCRLRHVAFLGYRHEHMQVAGLEPTSNPVRPLHGICLVSE